MIAQLALLTALTIGGQDSKWFDLPLSVNGEVSAKVVEVHADGNHKPLPSVNIQFRSITVTRLSLEPRPMRKVASSLQASLQPFTRWKPASQLA